MIAEAAFSLRRNRIDADQWKRRDLRRCSSSICRASASNINMRGVFVDQVTSKIARRAESSPFWKAKLKERESGMGIVDKLEEKWDKAEETATGTIGGAIGSLLSLPYATLIVLYSTAQAKNPFDAVTTIVQTYADRGEQIGRDY